MATKQLQKNLGSATRRLNEGADRITKAVKLALTTKSGASLEQAMDRIRRGAQLALDAAHDVKTNAETLVLERQSELKARAELAAKPKVVRKAEKNLAAATNQLTAAQAKVQKAAQVAELKAEKKKREAEEKAKKAKEVADLKAEKKQREADQKAAKKAEGHRKGVEAVTKKAAAAQQDRAAKAGKKAKSKKSLPSQAVVAAISPTAAWPFPQGAKP